MEHFVLFHHDYEVNTLPVDKELLKLAHQTENREGKFQRELPPYLQGGNSEKAGAAPEEAKRKKPRTRGFDPEPAVSFARFYLAFPAFLCYSESQSLEMGFGGYDEKGF